MISNTAKAPISHADITSVPTQCSKKPLRVLGRARWVPSLPSLQAAVHFPLFIPAPLLLIPHVFTCLIYKESWCEGGREGGFRADALKANQPTRCHLSPPTIKKFSGCEYFCAVFLHEKIWLFSHHFKTVSLHPNSFLLLFVVLMRKMSKGLELFLITTNFNTTDFKNDTILDGTKIKRKTTAWQLYA